MKKTVKRLESEREGSFFFFLEKPILKSATVRGTQIAFAEKH
jgi:hypothetical protein